jgi:hypothetical protein
MYYRAGMEGGRPFFLEVAFEAIVTVPATVAPPAAIPVRRGRIAGLIARSREIVWKSIVKTAKVKSENIVIWDKL